MADDLCGDLSDYKPLIKGIMRNSKSLGVELGVLFCAGEDKVTPADTCLGNECSLELKDCEPGNMHSSFHTHVSKGATVNPSGADLIKSWKDGTWGLCIGVPDTEEVKCYEFSMEKEDNEAVLKQARKVWEIHEDIEKRAARRYPEYRGEFFKLQKDVKDHMKVCTLKVDKND